MLKESVRNKTIIGLKLFLHWIISVSVTVRNKTIIGLKSNNNGTAMFTYS